jgi:Amt family ammonium transporter
MTTFSWLPLLLGYLIPIGFFLLGWGGLEPEQARRVAARGILALALATLGYFAVGFAFHLGGAAVVADQPGLTGLDRLLGHRVETGLYWGVVGLSGFFLSAGADTSEALILFATYLPAVATAVLLPTMSISARERGPRSTLVGFFISTVIFPLAACWAWGGGWLAGLGKTLNLGHGLADFGGGGVIYLLAGTVALGSLIAMGRPSPSSLGQREEMPPAHFPLLANLGLLLAVVGWMGWSLGVPFHAAGSQTEPARTVVNGLLSVGGATLTCMIYCWLALGRGEPLMMARGAAAGLMAVAAGAPFMPPIWAVVVGLLAGLLAPLGTYLVDGLLGLADDAGTVATAAFGGLWGLLATALFADGRWGQGWNGVGLEEYHTVVGQGLTGFLPQPGFIGDGPGQILAQMAGIVAIGLLGFAGGWLATKAGSALSRPQPPRGPGF